MKEILLVAAPHGNERLGNRLYSHMMDNCPDLIDHVDIIVGNPKAVVENKRFIDTDFNRSFYSDVAEGYEKHRAAYVSNYIGETAARLVLDMHTTRVPEPPCFIAYNMSGEVAKFMAASKINDVVKMHEMFARESLIGAHPNAVSVEVSDSQIDQQLLEDLAEDIKSYLDGATAHSHKNVYPVAGGVPKTPEFVNASLDEFVNFKWSKLGQFYPILMGENTYRTDDSKKYLGFYASEVIDLDVSTNESKG